MPVQTPLRQEQARELQHEHHGWRLLARHAQELLPMTGHAWQPPEMLQLELPAPRGHRRVLLVLRGCLVHENRVWPRQPIYAASVFCWAQARHEDLQPHALCRCVRAHADLHHDPQPEQRHAHLPQVHAHHELLLSWPFSHASF